MFGLWKIPSGHCHGLTPVGNSVPHNPSLSFPWWGGEQESKPRGLLWDKNNFIIELKQNIIIIIINNNGKEKRGIKPRKDEWCTAQWLTTHWPQPIPEQWPVAPSQVSPVYILSMTFHGLEYPFEHFGSAVPGYGPSQLFVHLLTSRAWETEKSCLKITLLSNN